MTRPQVIRSTMNTKEVAVYLGVSTATVRRYVHEQDMPVLKFRNGRKWLFRREYIDKWMEKRMDIDSQFQKQYEPEYGKLRILKP